MSGDIIIYCCGFQTHNQARPPANDDSVSCPDAVFNSNMCMKLYHYIVDIHKYMNKSREQAGKKNL